MSQWSSAKAKAGARRLAPCRWSVNENKLHKILSRRDGLMWSSLSRKDEIGPKMLARIAKHTGLKQKICSRFFSVQPGEEMLKDACQLE